MAMPGTASRFLLLQMRTGSVEDARLEHDLRAFCRAAAPWALHRAARSLDNAQAYVYLGSGAAAQAPDATVLAAAFRRHCAWADALQVSPLEPVFDVAGMSAGEAPRFHYVVETDPEDGWFDEIVRWYDTEHMPGLAAVPGCVRAMRFLNRGAGPLSLACYDLQREDVLGSPPWLAVRATAWSDIARPHFTNTKRTLFRILADT